MCRAGYGAPGSWGVSDQAPQLAAVQWTWRRVFAFVVTATNAGLLTLIIRRLDDAASLRILGLALVGLNVLVVLGYLLGATATDVMRIVLAWKTTTTVNRTEAET